MARGTRVILVLGVWGVSLLYALPLIWMFSSSLKPQAQVMAGGARLLPQPAWQTPAMARDNYAAVLRDDVIQFPVYLRNTLYVATLSVLGTVISSAIAAYGFARVRWRGRQVTFLLMLSGLMVPFPLIMVPLYAIFRELSWIGSFRPLWVPAWFGSAFGIFLLRQFFLTIPRELDEAARIDGCGHAGIFRHVILPLSKPALAVVALFQFLFTWNDFLAPLIFLSERDTFTLALGLHLFQSQQGSTPWNLLMAASTLFVAPALILFILTQKTFVRGVATAGLKA